MEHDQLFKDLLRRFLPDFLKLFFPRKAGQLDLSRLSFLDKEAFTDVPRGKRREVDLLAQVHTRKGEPELILLHVEVEGVRRADFGERMFQYYAVLRMRHGLPVLPIVLYVSGGSADGTGVEAYTEDLLGQRILSFQFLSVNLASLDGSAYVGKRNRLAGALAALMGPGEMSLPHLKAQCLSHVSKLHADEAERTLLINLVQTYLPLAGEDADEFARVLGQDEYAEVRTTVITYEEKLLRRGERRGEKRGKQATLIRLLERKFGGIPQSVRSSVSRIKSTEEIDRLSELVLTAQSLDDMELGTKEG